MKIPIYQNLCSNFIVGYIYIEDDAYKEYKIDKTKMNFKPTRNGVYLTIKEEEK